MTINSPVSWRVHHHTIREVNPHCDLSISLSSTLNLWFLYENQPGVGLAIPLDINNLDGQEYKL